jgi:Pyridine nucleotide-disulphide oxidoreductase, dimerisation domain
MTSTFCSIDRSTRQRRRAVGRSSRRRRQWIVGMRGERRDLIGSPPTQGHGQEDVLQLTRILGREQPEGTPLPGLKGWAPEAEQMSLGCELTRADSLPLAHLLHSLLGRALRGMRGHRHQIFPGGGPGCRLSGAMWSCRSRVVGADALGPEAGEWMQQATLAIRAQVPLDILRDTIQPFPSFSEIFASM